MSGYPFWDNHVCLPLRPADASFLPQLIRHRTAGARVLSINVGFGPVDFETVLAMLRSFRAWFGARPEAYRLIDTAADVDLGDARAGIVFDVEGADCLEDDARRLEVLQQLGLRWMSLVYNRNNRVGGGCQDDDRGLTPFGVEVLTTLERLGIVACCSHTGERTTLEVFDRATRPVIFSHSNAASRWAHARNVSDTAIRRCARTGGVVGINGIGIFLGRNDASVAAVVGQIEYVLDLVGPEHVGLGLDYIYDRAELDEYVTSHPELFPAAQGYGTGIAMLEPERVPEVADALLARGYADGVVRAVLSENWRRIAREGWAARAAAEG